MSAPSFASFHSLLHKSKQRGKKRPSQELYRHGLGGAPAILATPPRPSRMLPDFMSQCRICRRRRTHHGAAMQQQHLASVTGKSSFGVGAHMATTHKHSPTKQYQYKGTALLSTRMVCQPFRKSLAGLRALCSLTQPYNPSPCIHLAAVQVDEPARDVDGHLAPAVVPLQHILLAGAGVVDVAKQVAEWHVLLRGAQALATLNPGPSLPTHTSCMRVHPAQKAGMPAGWRHA